MFDYETDYNYEDPQGWSKYLEQLQEEVAWDEFVEKIEDRLNEQG